MCENVLVLLFPHPLLHLDVDRTLMVKGFFSYDCKTIKEKLEGGRMFLDNHKDNQKDNHKDNYKDNLKYKI